MTKNDGGPAFPRPFSSLDGNPEHGVSVEQNGMTLRDWFAGMPLNEQEITLLRCAYESDHPEATPYTLSCLRYFHADRMLTERVK